MGPWTGTQPSPPVKIKPVTACTRILEMHGFLVGMLHEHTGPVLNLPELGDNGGDLKLSSSLCQPWILRRSTGKPSRRESRPVTLTV